MKWCSMSIKVKSFLAIIFIFFFFSTALAAVFDYDPSAATRYGNNWCGLPLNQDGSPHYNDDRYYCWNGKDPHCKTHPSGGPDDCANFVSQSLIAGGLGFDCYGDRGMLQGQPLNCETCLILTRRTSRRGGLLDGVSHFACFYRKASQV